jgi:hypothetical protein
VISPEDSTVLDTSTRQVDQIGWPNVYLVLIPVGWMQLIKVHNSSLLES